MDSRYKDEARLHRQEALARRIGKALGEINSSSAGDCPDGEILAAYAERGLGDQEIAKWESHFAGCARCRQILLVLNASANTPLAEKEVARLGELAALTGARAETKPPASALAWPRFSDWRLRWLAPALGVAAAVAIFLVLRPPWRTTDRAPSETTLVAQVPNAELPSSTERAEDRTARDSVPAGNAEKSASAAKKQLGPSLEGDRSRAEADNPNRPATPQEKPRQNFTEDKISPEAHAKAAAPAPPAPAPSASALSSRAAAEAQAGTSPRAPAPPSASESATGTEAAPMVRTENGAASGVLQPQARADFPLNGRNFQPLAKLKAISAGAIVLRTPSGTVLWRVGNRGSIEHSTNSGQTWAPQSSPSSGDWLSGAAISDTICWVAGRNGAIAQTLDGEHWAAIPAPAQSADGTGKLPDWISIVASDSRAATVTANDGRKFMTADGGKTWQPRP